MFYSIKELNNTFFKDLDESKEIWADYLDNFIVSSYGRMKNKKKNKFVLPTEKGIYEVIYKFETVKISIKEIVQKFKKEEKTSDSRK